MEHLLVASLAAAFFLYLYDSLIVGPTAARIVLGGALGVTGMIALGDLHRPTYPIYGLAAGAVALLLVSIMQWLLVSRDATVMQMARRR